MRYTIQNADTELTIDTHGAEIVSLKKNGKERVWQNDDGTWSGHGPMLFPVCGRCTMVVDGIDRKISFHGFSSKRYFKLLEHGENFVRIALQADERTKKVYPFDFTVIATYTLTDDTVFVEYEVKNPSNKPMYFSIGAHESYALDQSVGNYELRFEKQEKLLHRFHGNDGRLSGKTKDYGESDIFVLPADFLTEGNTLIFKDIQSRKLVLAEHGGKALAEITFPDFSNLLLWHSKDSKFICIEPWLNLPDSKATIKTEFSQKDGVLCLPPKSAKRFVRSIRYF